MATKYRRITFMVTPEIEKSLDAFKRRYYDRSFSEVIRMLLTAGIESIGEISENSRAPNSP